MAGKRGREFLNSDRDYARGRTDGSACEERNPNRRRSVRANNKARAMENGKRVFLYLLGPYQWATIEAEIRRCVVRCANSPATHCGSVRLSRLDEAGGRNRTDGLLITSELLCP